MKKAYAVIFGEFKELSVLIPDETHPDDLWTLVEGEALHVLHWLQGFEDAKVETSIIDRRGRDRRFPDMYWGKGTSTIIAGGGSRSGVVGEVA